MHHHATPPLPTRMTSSCAALSVLCCAVLVLCCADMQWLLYELLWRDFFRFVTKKYAVTGIGQRNTQAAPATAAMAMA